MSDAVLTLDEERVVRGLNDRAALLYRRKADLMIGGRTRACA